MKEVFVFDSKSENRDRAGLGLGLCVYWGATIGRQQRSECAQGNEMIHRLIITLTLTLTLKALVGTAENSEC